MKSIQPTIRLLFSLLLLIITLRASAQYPVDTTITGTISSAKTIRATHTITVNPELFADGANGTVALEIVATNVCPCYPLAATASAAQNYVRTLTPRIPLNNADSLVLKQTCEVMESIQYIDGLGRPLQTVTVKGNPDATRDMIQPFAYDQFGREAQKYLPYTTASGTTGSYRSDALTAGQGVYSFYNSGGTSGQQQGNGIVTIPNPFAATSFEPSPLNRPLAQGAPGKPWGLDSAHTVKLVYTTNNDSTYTDAVHSRQVALYTATINSNGSRTLARASNTATYNPGQLYVTIIKDENWTSGNGRAGTAEEYKDKEGHVVLKRTFNQQGSTLQMLSTYYVYDDLGQLAFVLPPGAKPDSTVAITAITLNNLCYQYRYDERSRLTQKKLPGKGWDFMVYNKLDQMVLSQDSVQRTVNKWTVAKYDALGRPVITGIWNAGSVISQATLQSSIYGQAQWDKRDSTGNAATYPTGYVISSYPTTLNSYLTINYYDDYTAPNLPSGYMAPSNASSMTRSLPTATKTAVLNPDGSVSSNMLWAVHYYDDKGRNIKTYSQHYLGGTFDAQNYDEVNSAYDFTNQVTYTKRQHHTKAASGATTLTLANSYEYDHMNRKIRSWERINNAADSVVISQVALNEVGQLKNKQLHSTDHGVGFLQTLSYDYNERGWLRHSTSSGNLFNMELKYNEAAKAQYNGNIANQVWTTKDQAQQTYTYNYDKLNRLTAGASTNGNTERSITYDLMGNIKTLTRLSAASVMDSLTYSYINSGNQISSISDASGSATGKFMPSGTTTYNSYDGNGNTLYDGRNGATIQYNMLNLPDSITAKHISYTYDATGRKLRRNVNGTITQYVDGIQYDGSTIAFVQMEEGRVLNPTSTPNYEYALADHLGNSRLNFDTGSGAANVIQQDDYMPFGLEISVGGTVSPKNEYLYNKKELQEELGQYDYGARFYDPVIARWTTVDPLAEKSRRFSTYTYADASPIRFIDPDGMQTEEGTHKKKTKPKSDNSFGKTIADGIAYKNQATRSAVKQIFIALVSSIGVLTEPISDFNQHLKPGSKEYKELQAKGKKDVKAAAVSLAIGYAGGKVFGALGEALGGKSPLGYTPEPMLEPVFRGDTRSPSEIFTTGFEPRGTNMNLVSHVMGAQGSGFVPTSFEQNMAAQFATEGGYVYTIAQPTNGVNVNKVLGSLSPFPDEMELAIPGKIPSSSIIGAQKVGADAKLVGPFIKNQ